MDNKTNKPKESEDNTKKVETFSLNSLADLLSPDFVEHLYGLDPNSVEKQRQLNSNASTLKQKHLINSKHEEKLNEEEIELLNLVQKDDTPVQQKKEINKNPIKNNLLFEEKKNIEVQTNNNSNLMNNDCNNDFSKITNFIDRNEEQEADSTNISHAVFHQEQDFKQICKKFNENVTNVIKKYEKQDLKPVSLNYSFLEDLIIIEETIYQKCSTKFFQDLSTNKFLKYRTAQSLKDRYRGFLKKLKVEDISIMVSFMEQHSNLDLRKFYLFFEGPKEEKVFKKILQLNSKPRTSNYIANNLKKEQPNDETFDFDFDDEKEKKLNITKNLKKELSSEKNPAKSSVLSFFEKINNKKNNKQKISNEFVNMSVIGKQQKDLNSNGFINKKFSINLPKQELNEKDALMLFNKKVEIEKPPDFDQNTKLNKKPDINKNLAQKKIQSNHKNKVNKIINENIIHTRQSNTNLEENQDDPNKKSHRKTQDQFSKTKKSTNPIIRKESPTQLESLKINSKIVFCHHKNEYFLGSLLENISHKFENLENKKKDIMNDSDFLIVKQNEYPERRKIIKFNNYFNDNIQQKIFEISKKYKKDVWDIVGLIENFNGNFENMEAFLIGKETEVSSIWNTDEDEILKKLKSKDCVEFRLLMKYKGFDKIKERVKYKGYLLPFELL